MGWNRDADHTKADADNHANQCNPNNAEYGHSRGESEGNSNQTDNQSNGK